MTRKRDAGQGSLVKRADGRWQGSLRFQDPGSGKAKRVYVYAPSKQAARVKLRAAAARVQTGQAPLDSSVLLSDYAARWLAGPLAASDRAASTRSWYRVQVGHVVASLGAKRLSALRRSDVERLVADTRAAGLAASTQRGVLTACKALLSSAVADGLLASSPAAAVARPRLDQRTASALRTEAAAALLEAAPARLRPLLVVALATGLRRGELLAVHWADVDMDAQTLVVRRSLTTARTLGPTKTRSERVVALSDPALAALREQRATLARERLAAGGVWTPTDLVFPSSLGTPADPRNTSRAVSQAAKRAGLVGVSLHSLRHTAASHMLSSGVPISTVSAVMGHADIGTTVNVYGHLIADERRAAADALAASLRLGG